MRTLSRLQQLVFGVFVLSTTWLTGMYFLLNTSSVFAQSSSPDDSVNEQPALIASACATVTDISSQECLALEALFNSTNGSGWITKTNWLQSPNACSWYGITCTDQRVTTLLLAGNQLQGAIPPEIGNLTRLEFLDLRQNALTGAMPIQIGNLLKLTFIDLSRNRLSGAIPPEIGNLANLRSLLLYTNRLNGVIPNEIKNLTQLEVLFLFQNDLSGVIPNGIGNLNQLKALSLTGNQLSGDIPKEIGNLTNLVELHLSANQLTGTIPTEIGSLVQLEWLGLDNNLLTGTIPQEIGNLNKLVFLSLAKNQLSGSIPETIGNLIELKQLYLPNNRFTGSIPTSIENMHKLEKMTLSLNQFDGPLPEGLSKVNTLTLFNFDNTKLCEPKTDEFQAWLNSIRERGSLSSTDVKCKTRLSLVKSVTPALASLDDVMKGVTGTVNLTVTANATTTIILTDTIPHGLHFIADSAPPGTIYNSATQSLVYSSSLHPGESLFFTYKVTVDPNNQAGTAFSIITHITGEDAYPADATATIIIPTSTAIDILYLVYVGADNNLSDEGIRLLNDAETALDTQTGSTSRVIMLLLDGPGEDDTRVYRVQADPNHDRGCPSYKNPTCNGRYKPSQSLLEGLSDDTSSENSLSQFIINSANTYTNTKQIVLSVVGHGSGWSPDGYTGLPIGWPAQPLDAAMRPGLLWDNSTRETLSTAGLHRALESARAETGRKLSLIYLDACSMAMAEVAYEIADEADYMLASQNIKWASFPYGKLLSSTGKNGEEIGREWLKIEAEKLQRPGHPYTLSLIDLNKEKMNTMKEQQKKLTRVLWNQLDVPSTHSRIAEAWNNTQCFDSNYDYNINSDDTYCDLGSFLVQLSKQFSDTHEVTDSVQELLDAVNEVVLSKTHTNGIPWPYPQFKWNFDNKGAISGLSIYLPLQSEHNDARQVLYAGDYLKWVQDTEWNTVMEKYWSNGLGGYTLEPLTKCNSPHCLVTSKLLPVQEETEEFHVYLPAVTR